MAWSSSCCLAMELRLGEKVLVALERALSLQERGLIRARVDVDERVAFMNELALLVMNSGDETVHLAGD